MRGKRLFFVLISIILLIATIFGPGSPVKTAEAAGVQRTDALVLVNSTSLAYPDFQHFIQPYLDHLGVPYTVLNLASTEIPQADIGDYALIIVGHRELDTAGTLLSMAEQGYITAAVNMGTGLVNFDNELFTDGPAFAARYAYIQNIFSYIFDNPDLQLGVTFPAAPLHYIAGLHTPTTTIATSPMKPIDAALTSGSAIATNGSHLFLAATQYGSGRAVQWGSYAWMSNSIKGPLAGLDDLVWRSLVWAARKPFVMQGMPPFVSMRIDDESGNFDWIHIANEFGIKPWVGLFSDDIDAAEAADLSALTHSGQASAAIHAFGLRYVYSSHTASELSDAQVLANFTEATAWFGNNNVPISNYLVPHYYEFSTNVFEELGAWGVQCVGTLMLPGREYIPPSPLPPTPWLQNGPFRLFETGNANASINSIYYADYLPIPNHPELNGQFFNLVTEIRNDLNFEWFPDFNNVASTIEHGILQTRRALDSMALATLFSHGSRISGEWANNGPANWRTILQGTTQGLAGYHPIYITLDDACKYTRSIKDTNISTGTYNPVSKVVTTNFQRVSGVSGTSVPTKFYVFTDGEAFTLVDVPVFTNATTVNFTLPGPMDKRVLLPLLMR